MSTPSTPITVDTLTVGTRVRTRCVVDRYPSFLCRQGELGTVSVVEQKFVAVKMDNVLDGAEEWDNSIHWLEGVDLDDLDGDLEIVA